MLNFSFNVSTIVFDVDSIVVSVDSAPAAPGAPAGASTVTFTGGAVASVLGAPSGVGAGVPASVETIELNVLNLSFKVSTIVFDVD